MADLPKASQTQPNLFRRKGGIWSYVGLALVAGMASVWAYNTWFKPEPDPAPAAPTAPRHLVLISIDTLRADHLGSYGYSKKTSPNMDALAQQGVLFEQHYSCYPLTLPAHLTQFTGVSSLGHRVRDNLYHRLPDELGTLAEAMQGEGFKTGAFVSAHTMKGGSGLERGFEVYDDSDVRTLVPGRMTIAERKAPHTLKLAGDWISQQGAERFFCFIHLFDPHAPYESHSGFTEGDDNIARYDGEIAFTDAEIGRFIERLRTLDVFKDTLIVITSDHGEGLGEHGEMTHGYFCYESTTHVPLIVHGAPGIKAGTRVPWVVRNYDLAPTLVELMQLKSDVIRKQAHGVSLVPQMKDPAADPGLSAFVESHYAYLNANWSKIRGLRTDDDLTLFSGSDVVQTRAGKAVEDPAAVRAARDEITRLMGAWVPPRKGSAKPRESTSGSPYPGEVPMAQSFDPESLNDTRDLPSPHAMKDVLRAYQAAELAYDEEKFESCAESLRKLLAQHPDFAMAQRLLAAVTQGIVSANWRQIGREKCLELTREAAQALASASRSASRHGQPEGERAADLNRALLLAWLGDGRAAQDLADRVKDPRVAWFAALALYRDPATADRARVAETAAPLLKELKLSDADTKAAEAHLEAMRRGEALKLAPWEQ
ncbi:MAG: sulfatase [Planctomycetes bacterium]|nr:sulfatase [Planctomycetota bacterium]